MSHGLARAPASHERAQRLQLLGAERAIKLEVEGDPVQAQDVGQDELRVQARGRHAPLLEVAGGALKHVDERNHADLRPGTLTRPEVAA